VALMGLLFGRLTFDQTSPTLNTKHESELVRGLGPVTVLVYTHHILPQLATIPKSQTMLVQLLDLS